MAKVSKSVAVAVASAKKSSKQELVGRLFLDTIVAYNPKFVSRSVKMTEAVLLRIAELVGYQPDEKGEPMRGNRDRQQSTSDLLVKLETAGTDWENGGWAWYVATVQILVGDNGLLQITNGGNTFRAMYHWVVKLKKAEWLPCILQYDESVNFLCHDAVDSKRTNKQVLMAEMNIDAMEAGFMSTFFGYACTRTKGSSIKGGAKDKRTYQRIGKANAAIHFADDTVAPLQDDPFLVTAWNRIVVKTEKGNSVDSLGELLAELVEKKKWKHDVSTPMLFYAMLDVVGSRHPDALDLCEDDSFFHSDVWDKLIDAMVESVDVVVKYINAIWNPSAESGSFNEEQKYKALYDWAFKVFNLADGAKLSIKKSLDVQAAVQPGTQLVYKYIAASYVEE